DALPLEGGRFGRDGLRRRIPFARHVAFWNGALDDRPDGLAGDSIEHVHEALLRRLRDGLDGASVDGDVDKNRSAGDVPVPYAVVYELVVPFALAGLQIDGDQALAKQPLARP